MIVAIEQSHHESASNSSSLCDWDLDFVKRILAQSPFFLIWAFFNFDIKKGHKIKKQKQEKSSGCNSFLARKK